MTHRILVRPFFNRTAELAALVRARERAAGNGSRGPRGQMLLLYGRRRIGKTYLLQHFFEHEERRARSCYFLADQTTAAAQRSALATQLLAEFPDPGVAEPGEIAVSWNALLRFVTGQANAAGREGRGPVALILDEFPYLVQQTPELPSILQSWWDREGAHAPLVVVLCGSQLGAMQALGAESAPLYGRFTAGIHRLLPLRYDDAACFYRDSPLYDVPATLTMYGVLGGTPRYHALVDTSRPFGEEIVDLLLRPRAPLENEIGFLLGSEQIRDPAPYNAVLAAVAAGETQFGGILAASGTERGKLSYYLATLLELGWIERVLPLEEGSERRALYRIADPFLLFGYRFVRPLASALSFSDPETLYRERIAPRLPDYLGRFIFEGIALQWLQKNARPRLGLDIDDAGAWWSRDGQIEIDLMARLSERGGYLFGECKWSGNQPVGASVWRDLVGKVARLPEARWRERPRYVLFSVGGFAPELRALAADPANALHLVGPADLLPATTASAP